MPFPRRRLTRLDPHEVSLVPRGANLKQFLVHKSEDGGTDAADVLEAIIAKQNAEVRGETEPAQGTKPAKQPKKGTTDDADNPKHPPIKLDELDEDKKALAGYVAKILGEETVVRLSRGLTLHAPEAPDEDQAWAMEEVQKAFGRSFGPPRRPVPPTAAPMHPVAPPTAPPAAPPVPAVPPQQQHVPTNQGQGAPPVSPAADPVAPMGNQLPAQGASMSAPAQGALKALARILAPHKDEITADSVAEVLEAIGIPVGAPLDDPAAEADETDEATPANSPGQPLDEKPEYVALSLDSEPHHRNEDAMPTMDLSAFPPTQRAAMEAVVKSLEQSASAATKELVEKTAKLEEVNKGLLEEKAALKKRLDDQDSAVVLKEYVAKAATFDRAVAKADKMGLILKTLQDKDPALREELEAVLKATNEQLALNDEFGGMLGETGSSQGGNRGGSAQAQLDAMIDGYVAKGDSPGKTRAQVAVIVQKTAEGRKLMRQIDKENEERYRRFGAA